MIATSSNFALNRSAPASNGNRHGADILLALLPHSYDGTVEHRQYTHASACFMERRAYNFEKPVAQKLDSRKSFLDFIDNEIAHPHTPWGVCAQ